MPSTPANTQSGATAYEEQDKQNNRDRPTTSRGPRRLVPGLLMCGGAVLISLLVNHVASVVSSLLVAILLGVILANTVPLPTSSQPGLAFAAKRLLRIGVVLLGVQLVLSDIAGLGVAMIATVVAVVVIGIVGTLLIGRMLGVPHGQRILIACGFSICGAAAVAAAEGVVDAEEEDVVTAIALVVIFGTLMIPGLPLMAAPLGLTNEQAGLWAGGSIHEVAQVVAVGGTLGGSALAAAVVVKLARVLMLAPVLAVLGWHLRRTTTPTDGVKRTPIIPVFVLGFVAMVALRSTGLLSAPVVEGAQIAQTVLLSAAMFALGCSVRIATIREVGARPLVLAAASTALVATTALTGVLLST
ncbi:MAG: putative sulfate exporter family transporter [Ornithinimicrobium sp.]